MKKKKCITNDYAVFPMTSVITWSLCQWSLHPSSLGQKFELILKRLILGVVLNSLLNMIFRYISGQFVNKTSALIL